MVQEPDSEIPTLPARTLVTNPLDSISITEEKVLKKLNNLDPSKSAGPDEIHPRILKETASAIAPALTILYNKQLKHHEIPEDWRTATITAVLGRFPRVAIAGWTISVSGELCRL